MVQQVQYETVKVDVGGVAGAVSVASMAMDSGRNQGVLIKKLMGAVDYDGKTAGEGPYLYGMAHAISAAEIQEALEADPQDENNVPDTEYGNRQVMVLGVIPKASTASPADTVPYRSIRFPWKKIPEQTNLFFWVQNKHTGTVSAGTDVRFSYIIVQEWLDD